MDITRLLRKGAKLYFWLDAAAITIVILWLASGTLTGARTRIEWIGWLAILWLLGLILTFLIVVGTQPE